MGYILKITGGRDTGEEFILISGENLVGRSHLSHVRVYNEDVSGKHFILDISGKGVTLRNLSRNGTFLDGVLLHGTAEIQPGQKIKAGNTLVFTLLERPDAGNASPGVESEETSITKFVSDVGRPDGEEDEFATSVTKFAASVGENATEEGTETGERASATKVSSESPEKDAFTGVQESGEETSVTKFASGAPEEALHGNARESGEETSVTKFASGVPEETVRGNARESGEETSVTNFAAVRNGDATRAVGTAGGQKTDYGAESETPFGRKTGTTSGGTSAAIKTGFDEAPVDETPFASKADGFEAGPGEGESLDDAGEENHEFGEEADNADVNQTHVMQTRMASQEEMEFIKKQMRKQQQSRLFLRFLMFSLLAVGLGIIWIMKMPHKEAQLSWPQEVRGKEINYLTKYVPVWGGYEKGAFQLYCPQWPHMQVLEEGDRCTVHTFLGKEADVPLELIIRRVASEEHLYESHEKALKRIKEQYSSSSDEGTFNFTSTVLKVFLVADEGPAGNGIPCDIITYQRDMGSSSWYGIMRFFRCGVYDYTFRVEVPTSEKLRAHSILHEDSFLSIHPNFVRSHWEGDDKYIRGDVERMMLQIEDDLNNHNSPLQNADLERGIKSILAQTRYNSQREAFDRAMKLLLGLREKQEYWYDNMRIRWLRADKDRLEAEKLRIRNESQAIFSLVGDKRRFDILRDYWGQ